MGRNRQRLQLRDPETGDRIGTVDLSDAAGPLYSLPDCTGLTINEIDESTLGMVDQYAFSQATDTEIQRALGIDSALWDIEIGARAQAMRHRGKLALHLSQVRSALVAEDTGMQIWLGKQYLDQADKIKEEHKFTTPSVEITLDPTPSAPVDGCLMLPAPEGEGDREDVPYGR